MNRILSISQALPNVKAAVFAAMSPLVGLDGESLPAVYWEEATAARPKTYLVFQSQDNGGKQVPSIGGRGWTGLITIKAYAPTHDEVDLLLPRVELAMASATAPAGYDLTVMECYPLTLRSGDASKAGGLIFRLALYRQ